MSGSLRFGHSSDFSDLFGTSSESEDYIAGLVYLFILSASLTLIAFFVLLLLMCLGKKRVGFLSGAPFHRTRYIQYSNSTSTTSNNNISTDNEEQYNDNNHDKENNDNDNTQHYNFSKPSITVVSITGGGRACFGKDQSVWIRFCFVLSGLIVMLFSIFFVTFGLRDLNNTAASVNYASYQIINLTEQGILLINTTQTELTKNYNTIITAVSRELQPDNLCSNVTDNVTSDVVEVILDWAEKASNALIRLNETVNSNELNILKSVFQDTQQSAQNMYDTTASIDVTQWGSVSFIVINSVVVSILLVAATMARSGRMNTRFRCFIVWIVLPLFILLIVIAAIISSASVAGASANSDYCYPDLYKTNHNPTSILAPNTTSVFGNLSSNNDTTNVHFNSPDVSSLQVLIREGYEINSPEYNTAFFYITQCTVGDPKDFIEVANTSLVRTVSFSSPPNRSQEMF